MENTTKNRRKHERVSTDVDIKIAEILFGDDTTLRIGKTKNISYSGIYCNVNKFIDPLTKVEGILDLASGHSNNLKIPFKGIVVRIEPEKKIKDCDDYSVAIFFNEMILEHKKVIKRYLSTKVKKQL